MRETLLQWMTKCAAKPPVGYAGISHQQYMPQYQRRELKPDEQETMADESRKWLPRIFKSDADSPMVDAASPGRQALMSGLTAGGLGALAGGRLGRSAEKPFNAVSAAGLGIPAGLTDGGLGALAGGRLGRSAEKPFNAVSAAGLGIPAGLLTALIAYKQQQAQNRNIEESVRRLPQGATRRDVEADPVLQARRNRATQLSQAAMIAGALRRR